jgi:hypothetical protein
VCDSASIRHCDETVGYGGSPLARCGEPPPSSNRLVSLRGPVRADEAASHAVKRIAVAARRGRRDRKRRWTPLQPDPYGSPCWRCRREARRPERVTESLGEDRSTLSVPGLVVMRDLGVCQYYSDQSEPSCPDQDDISVRFVIVVPVRSMRSMRLAAAASCEC